MKAQNYLFFVLKMNKIASAFDLKNTFFVNPHGLNNKNNKSTAFDLAVLSRRAVDYPTFAQIVGTQIFFT